MQARTEGRTYFLPPVYFWHRIQNIPVGMWRVAFVLSASFPETTVASLRLPRHRSHFMSCSSCPLTFNPSLSPQLSLSSTRRLHASRRAIHLPEVHQFRGLGSESKGARSCLTLWTPWTVDHQAPPCMGLTPFQLPKFLPCLLSLRLGMLIALSVTTLHPTKLSYLMLVIIH